MRADLSATRFGFVTSLLRLRMMKRITLREKAAKSFWHERQIFTTKQAVAVTTA